MAIQIKGTSRPIDGFYRLVPEKNAAATPPKTVKPKKTVGTVNKVKPAMNKSKMNMFRISPGFGVL